MTKPEFNPIKPYSEAPRSAAGLFILLGLMAVAAVFVFGVLVGYYAVPR